MAQQPTRPTNTLMGVFWMVVTGIMFVCVTAGVKFVDGRVPAGQAAFLRYALGLVLLIPMLKHLSMSDFTKSNLTLLALRGIVHGIAVNLWFYAMSVIPMADVTAMNYMTPVYVTIGAALFLGETLALRRIIAIGVALIGAFIILRPGFRDVSSGHLAMLATSLGFAGSYLIAKRVSGYLHPSVVVVALSILVTIVLAPLAWWVWVPPSAVDVMLLFAVACFATVGHYTMTLAFAAAPVTVTQPVTFLQLIWAVATGAIVFAEAVDLWVIVGAGLIMIAISFMTWREAQSRKRVVTPHVQSEHPRVK